MAKKRSDQAAHGSPMSNGELEFLQIEAKHTFKLHTIGDQLAAKHGYTSLHGIEAVRFFLMQKHNWLPSQVRSMSYDDLKFAMSE